MTVGERAIHLDLEVTRRQFEQRIGKMVDSTILLAQKALDDAGLTSRDLSRILLVGGSTRIPLVRQRLEEAFAASVHEEVDVDLAVGLGAAVQSALLGGEPVDRILVDVSAHSLGIRVVGRHDDGFGPPDTFAPVLRRNTVLPSRRTEEFYTMEDDQPLLDVEVFQGESTRVSGNTPVGSFPCDLEARPAGSPVNVEFSYDLNGVVTVSVSQPGGKTKRTVAMSLADGASGASGHADREITSAVERKAVELLARVSVETKAALNTLLTKLRATTDADLRAEVEDELLDFFVDFDDESGASDDADVP
jgi:molecular chaperone DnaK